MIVSRRMGLYHLLQDGVRMLSGLFAWDVVVVLTFQLAHRPWMDQPALPFSLIGSALVLFLNMRNTAAYSRWWEARTLWGAVTNNARSFARQVESILQGAPDLTKAMAAYPHALRAALKEAGTPCDLHGLLTPDITASIANKRNQPNAILHQIAIRARQLAEQRGIHPAIYANLDQTLCELSNAQGGLERIRNTPLAMQFSVLPRLLVGIFCLVLPLSMVQELGWITPFGSTLVGVLFMALDEIGFELENPFRSSPHALPMEAMARTIEIDLLQAIEHPAPEPLQAHKGVLY